MRLLIDEIDRKIYEIQGSTLIDERGATRRLTSTDDSLLPVARFDAMLEFEYMKRRVLAGDLVCAYDNIGGMLERWWIADHFSPAGRVFNRDATYSCRIEDAIPMKYLPKALHLFQDSYQYELWIIAVTSQIPYQRRQAQDLLLGLVSANASVKNKLIYKGNGEAVSDLNHY